MIRPVRDPRIQELLGDDALFGLSEAERRELAASGADDDDTYALAAAAADLATLKVEPMPAEVHARLASAVDASKVAAPAAPESRRRAPRGVVLPWSLAAAGVLLAAGAWWAHATTEPPVRVVEVQVPAPPPARPTLAQQREELLRAPDARTIAWSGTKDPAGRDVAGDVVWSASEQRGFMRFVGLPVNDTSKSEYQLWIFDPAQEHPIDGGVFDVTGQAEVIVPVVAKLRVTQPTLFAVTMEKPGGVVVSKKEHIVAVAAVKG